MATAFARLSGEAIRDGLVIGTHLPIELPRKMTWHQAGHPLPDERSVAAGQRALDCARTTREDETLVVLLSGGASALMSVPASTLTLDDKRATVAALLASGADITALNTVRKHLSAVKGGRLAAASAGPTVCLAISDVVGDDLSVIGSGPAVPDPSTFADAWQYVERYGVRERLPARVAAVLQAGLRGDVEETPKPGDPRLARGIARVIGGRMNAMDGARDAAVALGYHVTVIDEPVIGEARVAGADLLARARTLAAKQPRPACVLAAGETTVTVVGKGKGGRNQEVALAAARLLAKDPENVGFASVGTDGVDGPTDAAGAVADTSTLARAAQRALDPDRYLADNNAYAFFSALNDLIVTGPSNTNVGDVQIVLFP